MALVLLCSVASGAHDIVVLRELIVEQLRLPPVLGSRSLRPAVVHADRPVGQDASRLVYVGCGRNDPQSRPSVFFNPFFFLCQSDAVANRLYGEWLSARMDLEFFLQPLLGMSLLCDCDRGVGCHVHILLRVLDRVFPLPGACEPHFGFVDSAFNSVLRPLVDLKLNVPNGATHTESDDSGGEEVVTINSRPDDVCRVDETRRGSFDSLTFSRERPAWPASWTSLIASIRLLTTMCFWEIFSGVAGLTTAFMNAGWACGPPIDILYCSDYDLLNPLFLGVCLGLIFERRIRMLHVGPPCSSFSMACNGTASTRMRSEQFPAGLPNLSKVRQEKVTLGNALAEVATKLCQAISLVGCLWTWEQPWTSLMWIYPPVKAFLLKYCEAKAYIDVCSFGAPWKKPTGLAANFEKILELVRYCTCTKPHQILRGTGPDGRAWTAIASPYWPAFADEWALTCGFCEPCEDELIPVTSHLHGFGVAPDDVPIAELLEEANFVPSSGTSVHTSALRIAAGLQPPGRRMPTILPEGLGPDEHLRVALGVQHPVARRVLLKPHIHHALDNQHSDPNHLISFRYRLMELVLALANALRSAAQRILGFVHRDLWGVLSKKNIALMRELNFICRCPDFSAVIDLVWGLPMAGWARHCPNLVQKLSSLPKPFSEILGGVDEHNRKVLASVRSTGDREADELAWSKSQKEFDTGGLLGPWSSLAEIPFKVFRLLQRFVIHEQHGGQAATVRCIDNALIGGQNEFSATTAAHRPCDLDTWVALCRIVGSKFLEPLSAITSDFKTAYRQVTSDPNQAHLWVIAMWCPVVCSVVFGAAVSQLFGSGTAPLNFSRYPSWCTWMVSILFLLPMEQCVDDLLSVERATTMLSGFHCWRSFAVACGWDVPDEKSPPPQRFLRTLGAMTDLRLFPDGPIKLLSAIERVEATISDLENILRERRLTPGFAGKLYGRMQWASSTIFGRFGRAMLRSFSRRQHEPGRFNLNNQIKAACEFWIRNLPNVRPREVPINPHLMPLAISYSDGEGETAGVGCALWLPDGTILGGYLKVPSIIRKMWARRESLDGVRDIYQIEAVGPLLVLYNWGHMFRDHLWIHFIDNEGALASLAKGSSSVLSGGIIVAYTHELAAQCGILGWFDRVDSASNPVDKLSRGEMRGPWKLVRIRFPVELLRRITEFEDALPFSQGIEFQ